MGFFLLYVTYAAVGKGLLDEAIPSVCIIKDDLEESP
jgi:hypothetical protein